MRVIIKLSCFHILIACSILFVNNYVQAGTIRKSLNKASSFIQRGFKSQAYQSSTTSYETSAEDGTTYSEATTFFHSLMYPPPPRIFKIDFKQKMDHFNKLDERTWIQKAYFDGQYEEDDGPVMLKIGQLKPVYPDELEHPIMVYLGKKLHAALYILEHRFYGESVPTNTTTENLELLCRTDQALADIENFIKNSAHADKPWIVFGTEYGGSLAAWFRMKYPSSAISALAFRAPLFAKMNEDETFSVLNNFNDEVKKTLRVAFFQLQEDIKQCRFVELKANFNMCTKLNIGNQSNNVDLMYWKIINHLSDIVQNSNEELINILMDEKIKNPLIRLSTVIKTIYEDRCFCVNFNDVVTKYKNVDIKYEYQIDYPMSIRIGLGIRPHFFQRCTEYGFFETSEDGLNTFGIKIYLDFYLKMCTHAFDRQFNPAKLMKAINNTNKLYGGKNIPATNLIFIIPENPYWRSIGMAESSKNVLIVIDYEANDVSSMKNSYELITHKLDTWTKNAYYEVNQYMNNQYNRA